MKRREFLGKGTAAAAAMAMVEALSKPVMAVEAANSNGQHSAAVAAKPQDDYTPYPAPQGPNYAWTSKAPVSVDRFTPADKRILPMSLDERIRRNLVPQRGMCSIAPSRSAHEGLLSGNGSMYIESSGQPFSEQIVFHQERLLIPWRRPFEAPKVAYILPTVRKLLLAGKYREGLKLAYEAMTNAGLPMNFKAHETIPAFLMRVELEGGESATDYLRTLDFESGEMRVFWKDKRGEWLRREFVSRPDDIVVQSLAAPQGQSFRATIVLEDPPVYHAINPGPIAFDQKLEASKLVFTGRFDPAVNNNGYASVTRLVQKGGSSRVEQGRLVIENAQSILLLTRIAWFADFSDAQVADLSRAVGGILPDYQALLARHRVVQSSIFNRVSVDFGGSAQHGMAAEELLSLQRTLHGFAPALLEQMFGMGRYWLMLSSGHYPPMAGEVNININLQVSGGVMGNLSEAMDAYFNWIESILPDCRNNARNIFGARGAVYPILPNKEMGVSFLYASTEGEGIWPHPYWISAGGWCYSPFWDHYLVTGDLKFLRDRVVPGLKELALFYEDFLTETNADGNYVFVPSFSPENWPTDAEPLPPSPWPPSPGWPQMEPPTPLVINACMDIMVCREVLTHLIEASEILGIESQNVPKWKAMLTKLPPYLLSSDGALKEWAWPTLEDHLDHRHVSHLYGAWPSDELDPSRVPELAKAALLADRKRAPGNSSAHGLCHRGLAGARLKDSYLVNFELKQLLEQGYVGPTLRTSHNPYRAPMPDAQGALPTLMMEMLVYARPGVIELLPALPDALQKGSIRGMLARTFVKVDSLSWDLAAKSEEVTLTSSRNQDLVLVVWHAIESISAPPNVLLEQPEPGASSCRIHLSAGEPVTLRLAVRSRARLNWVPANELADHSA